MKRRVVSWLMTVVMLLSLLPTSVWAETSYGVGQDTTPQTTPVETAEPSEGADGEGELTPEAAAPLSLTASAMPTAVSDVTVINTAADFAAMTYNGNYKLGADIEVTKPYSSKFSGTFDGDGHTVTLNITMSSSGNAGLFSQTGSSAVIKNVAVVADVTSAYASTSYGTAGLIGNVYGATTIENCAVSGSIKNTDTSSTGTYVGGIVGYLQDALIIKNCYSTASVSSSSTSNSIKTGGIIGGMSSGYSLTAENCYCSGDVTAVKGYAGGFIGYINASSYSGKIHTYTNCFTAGKVQVTGSTSNAYGFAYSYATSGFTFTDCYFNSGENTSGFNKTISGITGKTADELKDVNLGSEFVTVAGDYPILSWQQVDPNGVYTVSFDVTPIDAVLTWNGTAQTVNANGHYSFTVGVADGTQSYTVSNEAGDYAAQSGTVSVRNKDVTVSVNLELNTHTLTFTGLPTGAELTVKNSEGTTVSDNSDGSYSVVNGTYSYTATAFGYEEVTSTVTVDREDKQVAVTMDAAEGAQVTFENADEGTLTVKAKITDWTTKTMTGTNGVYNLPFGYTYSWTFTSNYYIDQSGEYTTVEGTTAHTITIPLNAKPTKNTDGYYEIKNADQLRWLAQKVNTSYSSTEKYNAVLCNDIDLGNQAWTPIGTSSYAYKGIFDGQGHEIKNLSITGSASGNYGLFGYVSGGAVKNLTVSGTISLTGNGSSSYGAAGIVGYITGSSAVVENCQNRATITGGQNVGGIVGYISSAKSVTGCVNTGNITSNSNNAGGIVGYISGQVTVDSCYNTATITSGSYRAGGITAYLYNSSAKVQNCYSTGNVSVTYGSEAHSIVGYKYSGAVNNCYYLSTATADSNATEKTSVELKGLASTLGDAFTTDDNNINDGYPILKWQIPTYDVTFSVTPADAVVTVNGETLEGSTTKLPDGEYTYTVSAFGYDNKSGSITVSGGEVTESVTLTAAQKKTVTFSVTPPGVDAKVTVTWNGDSKTVVSPTAEGAYTFELPYGNYTYTVKAKGYGKITGNLPVNADSANTVNVALTASSAWNGETTEEPTGSGTQAAPYEIDSGEQLAWLADKVNKAATVTKLYVKLTDNIDLGGMSFTPIGNSSKPFSGEFDGQGHTISGLNVSSVEYAGLFGAIKDATIKNVVVKGTVSGTSDAGGIVGRAVGTTNYITNCGNEAAVSVNKSNGGNAGGILGNSQNFDTTTKINCCYNTGSVSATGSSSRAGGIAGRCNNSDFYITDCYNIGVITSDAYAAGIYSGSSDKVSNCYNAGTVTGSEESKTGEITSTVGNTQANCFYLSGKNSGTNKSAKATAYSAAQMQSELLAKLGETNWKTARGVNGSMPVLKWQKVNTATGEAKLSEFVMFVAEEDGYSLSGDEIYLPTTKLAWDEVEGAKSYVITLYRAEQAGDSSITLSWVADIYDVTGTLESNTTNTTGGGQNSDALAGGAIIGGDGSYTFDCAYDCADVLAGLDEGVYYAAVSAVVDGKTVLPDDTVGEGGLDDLYLSVQPYNRMKAVTDLKWEGTVAKWKGRSGFTAKETYQIDIFLVNENNETISYSPYTSVWVDGNYSSADLGNLFAVGKMYAFRVTALVSGSGEATWLTDSLPSAISESSTQTTAPTPSEEDDWVEIYSAAQWIELANVQDVPSDGTGSPSKQQVEWSKNYRLTADIDFSTLSAADQAKTKSIGTVTYPFMGEFDGDGHTIKGLTLSNNDSGLFWYVGATGYIHDLTIDSANVLFSDNAAVLVHNNKGTIENCAVLNTNITADTGAVLGGMVSRNYGIIRDSYVQGGKLTSNTTTATGHAGFVGANEQGGRIERCWTSMTVSTQSNYAGGFVGLGYGGTIKNCFALGNVSAGGYSGGFVGRSVYDGNVYENCYAAGVVTVTGKEGNGFIGGNEPDSAFQYEQSEGITNCYYNSATQSSHDYKAVDKSLTEMKSAAFLTAISGSESGVWTRDDIENDGLPYLEGVAIPKSTPTNEITVQIAIATYDKTTYSFSQMGKTISLTMDSNGNTRVVDLMDAAVAQGKLTYEYATTSTFGRFIHTIKGYAVDAPDGWMFTVNDTLSNVSASLATVKNGDKLLWFEGTTENHFQGPTWEQLSNPTEEWVDITTVAQLIELAKATDAETLAKNYRLTADLDLNGKSFNGIGSVSKPFTGKFDGQGHTVKNVTVNGTDNVGFFNVIKGATITNLTLDSVTVSGRENVGGLVGHAQVYLNSNDLSKNVANLIGNCTVSGTVSGSVSVGGLVGLNDGTSDSKTGFSIASSVNNSHANVAVTGTGSGTEANQKIGGLVGENGGTVTDSSATGDVQGETMVGGLAGRNRGSIYRSHAEGEVEGDSNVGGFVGLTDGTIEKCYSLGAVFGSNNTGGFAGKITGTVDTAMSAGRVNGETRMRSTGYIGGFAGYLEGKLTGLDNQITVKDVYGNCMGGLPAVGNASTFSSDAEEAVLNEMKLTSMPVVSAKIYELFTVYLPVIQNGLDTFHDVTVAYDTAKNTALTLGTVPEGCTVSYEVQTDNSYVEASADKKSVKLVKANDVTAPLSVQVNVTLTAADESCGEKTVTVRLLPAYTQLLHTLAKGYQSTKDEWAAMDMMAYSKLSSAKYSLSADAKQNVINLLIGDVTKAGASVSDYSRAEIILRSLGIDSTKLYPANSAAVVNNAMLLQGMDSLTTEWVYGAPLWGMLAALQGNVKLTNAQVTDILGLIQENMGTDGLFGYEWGGVYYASPDTAATALAALQPYVATNTAAKDLADKLCAGLKSYFAANGTFGNANSDAMVIIGLIAAGEDPYDVKTVDGKTVVDALLSWVNNDADGFVFYGETNDLATEQGFRALVALEQFNTGKTAYNIYDFSANRVTAGQVIGTGTEETPETPTETDEITVSVTISSPSGVWFSGNVTVKKNSTVYHAFMAAVEAGGISQVGAASGYVRSMTKNGVTYGEFTHGENSGWLYKVNGTLPNVGLTGYTIQNGDSIYWYYTLDWKLDPDAGKMAEDEVTAEEVIKLIDAIGTVTLDSGDTINAARMAYNKLSTEEKAKVTNYDVLVAAEAAYARLLLEEKENAATPTLDWQTPYETALNEVAKRELTFGDEWPVIALARSGKAIPEGYYESVLKAVQAAEGNLSDTKYTEYSRTILALTAIGKDPTDVGGYDLLEKLADMDKVTYQGINGAIFALIALDSGHYDVPTAAEGATQTSREALLDYLLASQLSGGGWTLSGTSADVDVTAMAVQALAAYYKENEAVKNAVDKALDTLSAMQLADGSFGSWGTVNSESCAQVIIALTALGIDPTTDSRFLKHGLSPLDALCAFYTDGGFAHEVDGDVDAMATEQALCALTAYYRFTNGLSALYDMADTAVTVIPAQPTAPTEESKETSVVVWVAAGALAAAAGGGLLAVKRRKRS